jgi:hypothetical protein
MGEKDPYPALLGIDWAYKNYVVIDIKKETMTFESDGMKVTQPLDPYQGPRYTEPTDDNMEVDVIDQLYALTIGKKMIISILLRMDQLVGEVSSQ